MKKIMSFLITLTLLLSAITVPVRAEAETQRIYARIWGRSDVREECPWNLVDEDGYIYYAALPDDSEIQFAREAWFTYEKRKGKNGDYLYVTGIEEIPEVGFEVGYLYSVNSTTQTVKIYSNEWHEYEIDYRNRYTVNGLDILGEDNFINEIKDYKGAVYFKLSHGRLREINFIETPKQSIVNQRYNAETNTFDGLKYPITENTNICYDEGITFGGFLPGYVYSFDVISYDKYKNARFVIVHDEFATGMGLCISTPDADSRTIITQSEDGRKRLWYPDSSDILHGINVNTMIEFKYVDESFGGSMLSATPLEGKDFTGYTYNKENNTFGGYSLKDVSVLDVEIDAETGDITKYEPLVPSDKLQYDGKVFTSSYGQSVLWITGSKPADGNPVVEFWSNPSESGCKIGAIYHKNGYTGNGTIYLAVYCKGNLRDVYSYNLSENDSQYSDYHEEYDPVIFKKFTYDENTDESDYAVKGFVWYNDLTPIYPAFSA